MIACEFMLHRIRPCFWALLDQNMAIYYITYLLILKNFRIHNEVKNVMKSDFNAFQCFLKDFLFDSSIIKKSRENVVGINSLFNSQCQLPKVIMKDERLCGMIYLQDLPKLVLNCSRQFLWFSETFSSLKWSRFRKTQILSTEYLFTKLVQKCLNFNYMTYWFWLWWGLLFNNHNPWWWWW